MITTSSPPWTGTPDGHDAPARGDPGHQPDVTQWACTALDLRDPDLRKADCTTEGDCVYCLCSL